MRTKTKKLSVSSLAAVMLIMALSFTLPVSAVVQSETFWGYQSFTTATTAFSDDMQYGFHVELYSTLELPSDWYLDYTMGFYLTNSSNDGYYIGLHQYRGAAQIYVNPVLNGIYYGMDNQPYHRALVYSISSLFGCLVYVNYNSTTGAFSIGENGVTLIANTFSGIHLTDYKVENPLGRDQIAGNVHLLAFGADNPDGSYNNPIYNGIDFQCMTDNINSSSGGSVTWVRSTDLGIGGGQTGGLGYSTIFSNLDMATITSTANPGYVFESYFVSDNFYGGEFLPTGYYDPSGRLIASLDLLHLYPTETGELMTTEDIGNSINPLSFPVISSSFISSLNNGNIGVPGYGVSGLYWHNATGYYSTFILNAPVYDIPTNWEAFIGQTTTVRPQTVGISTSNPLTVRYYGGNYTVYASFVSINYNPNNMTPLPTATPSGNVPFNFGLGSVNTGLMMVIYMLAGAGLTFGAVAVFMKASQAWAIAFILLIAGLAVTILGQPNLLGLGVFFLEIIAYAVFLYSGAGKVIVSGK